MEAALTPKTKIVIANSPNNPTGSVIPPMEFARLQDFCNRHNIWLLSDECYSHFVYKDAKPFSAASIPGPKDRLIIAGSFSKTFAMTGLRLGYILAPKPLVDAIAKLQSQSTSNPTSIIQYAGLAAMRGSMDTVTAMQEEYARRREHILAGLRTIPGVTCTPPMGAFYVFPECRGAFQSANAGHYCCRETTSRARTCRGHSGRGVRRAGIFAPLLRHLDGAHRRRSAPPGALLR